MLSGLRGLACHLAVRITLLTAAGGGVGVGVGWGGGARNKQAVYCSQLVHVLTSLVLTCTYQDWAWQCSVQHELI